MDVKGRQKYMQEYRFKHCDESSKYEKMAKIGHGTFGEVFKAKDKTNPKKFVAMKKILMENKKEGFPITALREIKILRSMNHKNIVNLIEICRTQATPNNNYKPSTYLIFEFCEHDLAGLLANLNVKFNLAEKKGLLKQLLYGLHYIHCQHILHRDIKAANVLITKTGVLKLADFGLSRTLNSSNNNGDTKPYTNRVVTLWYRPPELLLGDKNYGSAVDLWGAGCIMAELWTRSPIIPGNSEVQQLALISKMCGSISTKVWPSVEKLEYYKKFVLTQGLPRRVKDKLRPYVKDNLACDLLDKLLVLDPSKRFNADKALDHDFFWEDPLPTDLQNILSQHNQSMFEYLTPSRKQGQGLQHLMDNANP